MENNNENKNVNNTNENNENKTNKTETKKKGFNFKRLLIDVGLVAGGAVGTLALCYVIGSSKAKKAAVDAGVNAISAAV